MTSIGSCPQLAGLDRLACIDGAEYGSMQKLDRSESVGLSGGWEVKGGGQLNRWCDLMRTNPIGSTQIGWQSTELRRNRLELNCRWPFYWLGFVYSFVWGPNRLSNLSGIGTNRTELMEKIRYGWRNWHMSSALIQVDPNRLNRSCVCVWRRIDWARLTETFDSSQWAMWRRSRNGHTSPKIDK